jgi:hypothetical protein
MQSGNLSSSRRGKSRRVLTVKMLAGKTAWLDARLRWRDGRVVWDRPGGPVVPRPADLAEARRALDQIARYPVASVRALGDPAALLERRRARLEIAKLLREIDEPDLSALVREARGGSDGAMRRLLGALVAGALCAEPLPIEPSRAVVACAGGAGPLLRRLLADERAPREGRALAAMTLGALRSNDATPLSRDPWIRRAYEWGRREGLPADPTTILAILAETNGVALARRFLAARSVASGFHLPESALREMLADGVTGERVTEIVEACAGAAHVAESLLEYRSALPDPPSRECRRSAAGRLAAERAAAFADLAAGVHRYVRATPDPAVISAVSTLARSLRRILGFPSQIARALTAALRVGSELESDLRLPFLNLLVTCQHRIWDLETLPDIPDPSKAGRVNAWFEMRHGKAVKHVQVLLRRTRDARLVRDLVDHKLTTWLCDYEWSEAERYRLVMQLGLACEAPGTSYLYVQLGNAVDDYGSAAAARAAIEPVLGGLAPAPPEMRRNLTGYFLEAGGASREARRTVFPGLARFGNRLLSFAVEHELYFKLSDCLEALVVVERTTPELTDAVLDLLLAHVHEGEPQDYSGGILFAPATKLGLAVAGSDLSRFKRVFDTVLRSTSTSQTMWLKAGVLAIDRHPAIRMACVKAFERQSRRCIALLTLLGQAIELGPAALEPLATLNRLVREGSPHADGCLDDRLYARARLLLGEDETLPAGVRRALDLPRKLERELAYVDALREREPEREDLASRASSLRNRLAAGSASRLRARAEKDAGERLERATTEALLSAAEQQLLACFRKQFLSLVGAMPAGLRFDDDLLNAVFMSVDLETNRKHLVTLIREHAWGDGEWRARIPANAAFLGKLAARDVDPEVWLGEHPRWYDCEAAAGGRVRLALERDPIRVLQMGNYFGTCLAAMGINSFSAVANACELNKRVVYATNGEGRVVGRKLIGIDEAGRMIGFQTYVGLHDGEANDALLAAFLDYARSFAATCGLTLADEGTVPRLFVEDWYDDGACAWEPEAGSR